MQNMNCASCRTPIPKHIYKVAIAGCPQCGMVSTMGVDGYLRTLKTYQKTDNYQEPFLLGEEIQHNEQHYTVHAIYVYFINYQEWDSEDSAWTTHTGFVTEWYAKTVGNAQLTLMRDVDNAFYTVHRSSNSQLSEWQIKEKFIEIGTFELNAFVGTDDGALDEKGYYRCFPNNLMIESGSENYTGNNFKTFVIKPLTPSQVKRMEVIPDTEQEEAEEDFKTTSFYRNVFGIALLFILGLMAFGNANTEGPQKSELLTFENKTDDKGRIDTLALRPKSAGIFNLKAGKNYLFSAKSNVYETNKEADFSISIVRKEDAATVSEVDIAFYTESGRDDDGAWTENYLSDEFKFQVDKSGQYEIFASPDYGDLNTIPSESLMISIEKTGYNYFYWMAASLLLLVTTIFQWQRENIVAYANLPYSTYLHDFLKQ